LGLPEILNVLQQGTQKKGSKATVGAKNEVEHIQEENGVDGTVIVFVHHKFIISEIRFCCKHLGS